MVEHIIFRSFLSIRATVQLKPKALADDTTLKSKGAPIQDNSRAMLMTEKELLKFYGVL